MHCTRRWACVRAGAVVWGGRRAASRVLLVALLLARLRLVQTWFELREVWMLYDCLQLLWERRVEDRLDSQEAHPETLPPRLAGFSPPSHLLHERCSVGSPPLKAQPVLTNPKRRKGGMDSYRKEHNSYFKH